MATGNSPESPLTCFPTSINASRSTRCEESGGSNALAGSSPNPRSRAEKKIQRLRRRIALPVVVDRHADHDSEQPDPNRTFAAETVQAAKGSKESILHDVLRVGDVPRRRHGELQQLGPMLPSAGPECQLGVFLKRSRLRPYALHLLRHRHDRTRSVATKASRQPRLI